LCLTGLLRQNLILPLAVEMYEEERSDDVNTKLSSLHISPISNDDASKVDLHNCTALTDTEVKPEDGCIDERLPTADDCHLESDETNEKVTVDANKAIFENASNAESLLSPCENPVTNLA